VVTVVQDMCMCWSLVLVPRGTWLELSVDNGGARSGNTKFQAPSSREPSNLKLQSVVFHTLGMVIPVWKRLKSLEENGLALGTGLKPEVNDPRLEVDVIGGGANDDTRVLRRTGNSAFPGIYASFCLLAGRSGECWACYL
jgi:hypothetical protein